MSDIKKLLIGIILAIIGMGLFFGSSIVSAILGIVVGLPGLGLIVYTLWRGNL